MPPEEMFELERILGTLVDGCLQPEDRERLAQLLRGNPEAQGFYRDYVAMHVALEYRFGTPASKIDRTFDKGTAAEAGGERLPFSDAMILPSITVSDEQFKAPESVAILTPEGTVYPRSSRKTDKASQRKSPLRWGWWALAASVALVAGASLLLVERPSKTTPVPPQALARVSDQVGAVWADPRASSSVFAGERLRLAGGFAELTFTSGAKVVMQAPAELMVDAANALSLSRGKMTARIAGGGFVVQTPSAAVKDLGTEFGIQVGQDDVTRVEVFEGKVAAKPLNAADAFSTPTLTVGQAADVSKQTLRLDPAGFRPGQFVRSLNAVIVRGELVADLRPDVAPGTSVWSNHATGSASVGDFAPPRPELLAIESVPSSQGDVLQAIVLQASGIGVLHSSKEVPADITGAGNVSVEAWVKVKGDATDFRTVAYWGKQDVGTQRAFMFGRDTPFMGYYSDVNGWGKGAPSGEAWHYAVWTYQQAGQQLTVYLDGQMVTSAKVTLNTARSLLFLGARSTSSSSAPSGEILNGALLAFRVHTGILQKEDVQHNYIVGMGNPNRIAIEK